MTIPDPALVVLIGASGAGKSHWAADRYRAQEIVSSDALRGVLGSGEHDLGASAEAFTLLDTIVEARVRRGLTAVIDTLGLDPARRRGYRALAARSGLRAVAVLLRTDPAECRRRNRLRDRPVPAQALGAQLRRMRAVVDEVADEGWDVVVDVAAPSDDDPGVTAPRVTAPRVTASRTERPAGRQLQFMLQISRFPWGDDPAGWLRSVVDAAATSGFEGIALMDHLIQIPQVGRAWEPIPEPWVTLGLLAGVAPDLRLGTLVSPVTFRAPGLLAKTVATLDALNGGRTFCGIGAGWWGREHAAFGLPFPAAAERLDALEAAIGTMRALWAPGTKPVGDLPETTCYPRPASSVPIIVGGSGERRTLRIAARLGDGCNLPADLATLDRKIAVLAAHCRDVGRDPAQVEVTVLDVPVVGVTREQVAATVERLRGRTPAAVFAQRQHAGLVPEHVARYRGLAERGVGTIFVSLPDLAGPGEVLRHAPIISALR